MTASTGTPPPRQDRLLEDDEAPPAPRPATAGDRAHPAGLQRVLFVAASLGLCGLFPYVLPGLDSFQAVRPGSNPPFSGVFRFEPPIERPHISGGTQGPTPGTSDDDLLAAALPGPAPGARPVATPPPTPPAPEGEEGQPSPPRPAPRVPPEQLRGLRSGIETFTGQELDFFLGHLTAVARDEAGTARISMFSVSTNGADRVSSTLRRRLQAFFGDAGKGFVPVAPGWTYHGHLDVEWESHAWRTLVVNRGQGPLGRYGLGGVLAINRGPGSFVQVGTTSSGPSNQETSWLQVFYQSWPEGGSFQLAVDGEPQGTVSARSDEVVDQVHQLRVPRGPHEFRLRPQEGLLRMYGLAMENDGPGVVVDALIFVGAAVRMFQNMDVDHWATQVEQRAPDLLLFWLGGNDVIYRHFTPQDFRRDYGTVVERVRRGRPEASCLVVSVLDKGYMRDGQVRTRVYVEPVVAAQAKVAQDQGCAFFNLYQALGGRNTMRRWFAARPRLAVADFTHLTGVGARAVGTVMARAILKSYDDYVAPAAEP